MLFHENDLSYRSDEWESGVQRCLHLWQDKPRFVGRWKNCLQFYHILLRVTEIIKILGVWNDFYFYYFVLT